MIIGSLITEKQIERGLYKKLSLVLEVNEHYPSKIGKTESQFKTALQSLKDAGKLIIGLEGVSSGQNKNTALENRIVILKNQISIGEYGKFLQFIDEDTKVNPSDPTIGTKKQIDGMVYNLEYEFRYITTDVNAEREIVRMINIAFGNRRHIASVKDDNSTGQSFFITFLGVTNVSSEGEIEKGIRYLVKDIWLMDPEIIRTDIPDATITPEINISNTIE